MYFIKHEITSFSSMAELKANCYVGEFKHNAVKLDRSD